MAMLTLPCPLWEGTFGALQGGPRAAAASTAPAPHLLKAAREPSHPSAHRWTPACNSAHAHSDQDLAFTDTVSSRASAHSTPSFAVGWLCGEDSTELRRAGAEADLSRATLPEFDHGLSLHHHHRELAGRDSCDDLSTILTTSRSEYGTSVSASSWSSGSYVSNAGHSPREVHEGSLNAGPGPRWLRRTRSPSPERRSSLGFDAYETPPRRLRMSANQPSPHGNVQATQPFGTAPTTAAVQVFGNTGPGYSTASQCATGAWSAGGLLLSGFKRRLPPPRPVSRGMLSREVSMQLEVSTPSPLLPSASHCSRAAAVRSLSCDPFGQSDESHCSDSGAEPHFARSPSLDHLLDMCRHLRETESRSGWSLSCASEASLTCDPADEQTRVLPKPSASDEAETVVCKEQENACSTVTCIPQEVPADASSLSGPPSTVRSCGSGQEYWGNASSCSNAHGNEGDADCRQLPPAAAAVPLPLSVGLAAATPQPLAAQDTEAESSDDKPAAAALVGVTSSSSEVQPSALVHPSDDSEFDETLGRALAMETRLAVRTVQREPEDTPTYLWAAGGGGFSRVSPCVSKNTTAVQELFQCNVKQPRRNTKLQQETLSTGVVDVCCSRNATGEDVLLPAKLTARLPDPPRSLKFEWQGQKQAELWEQVQKRSVGQQCHDQASGQQCDAVEKVPFADLWCTFAEDAVHVLQLPQKGCRRASSWAPNQRARCGVGRRRRHRSSATGGPAAPAPSSVTLSGSQAAFAASARRARGHLHRACSIDAQDADDTVSSSSARRARSHLNRSESQNSLIRQSQEALQAGQLKHLQRTRSQLKEEQRLAAAKVQELQQGFCSVLPISDDDTLFMEVAQMLQMQGMPNVEIKSISRTVMNERYVQAYQQNRGSKAERVLWLASPALDIRPILESEHCLDYRHATFGQLGRGLYGADLAVYADMFSAHETESGVKQLLLYKGIVGKPLCCFTGTSENSGVQLGSLMRTTAPPGHDSICAPEAALCKACASTKPGCPLEVRCACPFMPVGYQSEHGKRIKGRVSSPLYCLLPPTGHIQDQLLLEPSELEPYVLALPLALVEYVNPDSKASDLGPRSGQLHWWHPDVAHVLQRYQKALAGERATRSGRLEEALAHRDSLEARAAEAELDLAAEREDKKQLEKTIKALQSERDELQVALNSATGSPEPRLSAVSDATASNAWSRSRIGAAPYSPSLRGSPKHTGMLSPAPDPNSGSRGETPSALNRSGSFAGSDDSDHPEYWMEEFSQTPDAEFDSTDGHKSPTSEPTASPLHGPKQHRVGLDFRSVQTANEFIKTVKESASPSAPKDSSSHRGSAHHAAPFAPSTLGHCVVLGDPVESELMDVPELVEVHLRHFVHAGGPEQAASRTIVHSGSHAAGHSGISARHAGRNEMSPQRPRLLTYDGTSTQRGQKTSRAAIDSATSGTARHGSTIRRRRVKFCDELDGPETSISARKMIRAHAPQMEDVKKSILKFSHTASL